MKNPIRTAMVFSAIFAASLFFSPGHAKENVKQVVKEICGQAGGTYSSGSNYARCQYSNGDSYTCNTDADQCEACTNGKCGAAAKRPGLQMAPAANMNARPAAAKPARPAPATAPAGMMHKHAP